MSHALFIYLFWVKIILYWDVGEGGDRVNCKIQFSLTPSQTEVLSYQ